MTVLTVLLVNLTLASSIVSDRQEKVNNVRDASSSINSGIDLGETSVKNLKKAESIIKKLPPFTAISASGPIKIKIIKGEPSVEITGDPADLKQITIDTSNSRLTIGGKQDTQVGEIVATISATGLTELRLNGAVYCQAEIAAEKFSFSASGAGEILLTGQCREVKLVLSGAFDADAGGLNAGQVAIKIDGASSLTVSAAELLLGTVTGASSVYYKNNPKKIAVETSGAASINLLEQR